MKTQFNQVSTTVLIAIDSFFCCLVATFVFYSKLTLTAKTGRLDHILPGEWTFLW
jgi:hypothetical protein